MNSLIQTGTFDVENYGDLMFPLILQKKLPGYEVCHLSPCGGGPVWSDCVSSVKLQDHLGKPFDAVIIGGGNIIHPNRSDLSSYAACGVETRGYADLWIGATLSVTRDVPVLWNAPGVPRPIKPGFKPIVREALERADYISVRDEVSRKFLLDVCPGLDIAVVPDTVWDLPSIWTVEELDAEFVALTGGLSEASGPHISIHVNDRYAKDIDSKELAEVIDKLCREMQASAILVAIGPCHGDGSFARKIAGQMTAPTVLIDRPASLKQLCAAISRSDFYCGSSMHGYLTAAAFAVPALVVARKTVKFDGLVRQAGSPVTLVSSWNKVLSTFANIDRSKLSAVFSENQKVRSSELKAHWSEINEQLEPTLHAEHGAFGRAEFLEYHSRFDKCLAQVGRRQFSFLGKLVSGVRKLSGQL
ncbi:MAG: polysaccharide pyruvyl transferase family protein [Roseovarius sp.]|nr:polysaccharide pyruvyl transferase family protein [Roseovarius sp.]